MGLLMPRKDLRRWRTARTLDDLGALTAQWLEGEISTRPGYMRGAGPDPETTALIPVLARMNRTGFVTDSSQPGEPDDGDGWVQRAAVTGFADMRLAFRLAAAAERAELLVIVSSDRLGFRHGEGDDITVTCDDGDPYTSFGPLPAAVVRDEVTGWGLCRNAVDALCAACQLTVVDPEWGRDGVLWDVLAAALAPKGGEAR